MTIADSAVLVTGANRGIGQALVEEALRRGAKRVYAGTRQPLAHSDGRVTPLILDVTNAAQIRAAVESVESLDVLVNNAGVALYDDLSDRALLERHLAVNLFGTYGVTQAFLPLLTRSRGAIVNVLSDTAVCRLPADPGLFDLQGGRLQPDPIAASPVGRTGREGPCRHGRPRGHRHDTRRRHPEGLPGVRRPSHLRRRGQRGGGDLPRSQVSVDGRELAQQSGQGARTPVCGARRSSSTVESMSDLSDRTTVVVGASRGLGRGIARAFAEAGAPVVAVARTAPALAELAATSANIRTEVADAADETVAWSLVDRYEPEVLILVAGANPVMRPLQQQTWETFSVNWHTDVKIAFTWLREALLKPLPPGSRVVVVSSGAAINGSPASGGYAGAKATQRFIAGYAQEESCRAGLDITVTAVMPRMTPFGDVGRRGIRAYAARSGQTEEAYLQQLGDPLTPEIAGSALVDLILADPATTAPGYLLTGAGLQKLP